MPSLVAALVWLLIAVIVFAILILIVKAIGLPDPWFRIALAILGLIFLLLFLAQLGILPGGPIVHFPAR
jgi:hypothetical protein